MATACVSLLLFNSTELASHRDRSRLRSSYDARKGTLCGHFRRRARVQRDANDLDPADIAPAYVGRFLSRWPWAVAHGSVGADVEEPASGDECQRPQQDADREQDPMGGHQ